MMQSLIVLTLGMFGVESSDGGLFPWSFQGHYCVGKSY